MAAQLLNEALKLIEEGMHSQILIRGFRNAQHIVSIQSSNFFTFFKINIIISLTISVWNVSKKYQSKWTQKNKQNQENS